MKEILKNRRLWILIVVVLLSLGILVFAIALLSEREDSRPYPENGVLDLGEWNTKKDGALSLNGQWDFYWERFLSYEELTDRSPAPDLTVEVPEVWNSYEIKGKALPGFGHATYVLKVVNAPKGKSLALRIPTFSTAYEFYIDDQFFASNGRVGSNKDEYEPGYMPEVVEYHVEKDSFTLIFHVSNYTYARGGMWYDIPMGTPEQIQRIDQMIADKDLFLFGALAVMAFYYLVIFLLRREDKSSLYYVIMCLLFATRTAIYGDYLIYRLLPFISFRTIINISYITLCWFSICSAYMVGELFPEENSKKVLRVGFLYGVSMTLLFLFTPISFFTRWVNIVQALAILFGAYSVYTLSKAFIRGKRDAGIVLLGALVLIVAATHDVLYNNNIIVSNTGELVSFSLFILLLLQSFILSRRFSEAFDNVRTLSTKLIKLDQIKDEFLANTSHELRTPLSGILGITEAMLRGSDGEMNERQKKNLSIIAGSSRRLANLVNDILDYSKMKNGDIKLDIRPISIEALIHSVVNVLSQLSKSKELDLIIDITERLPMVMADENRVAQILYNLIGNATKFTGSGYVKVSAKEEDEMLEICVSDTGEGIPEDKLEDIFKSFEQVDNTLTRRYGGTGLGLTITKQLVELQGGSIWVNSTLGKGSDFYFTLPVAKPYDKLKAAVDTLEPPISERKTATEAFDLPAGELPAAQISFSEARMITEGVKATEGAIQVLLVDDDVVNLQAASAILKLGGYKVTLSNSGKAALWELKKQIDYSLVILDVMMPEISGFEVCRKIRERRSSFELPVLMLTAKASTADIVMGFEAGANDYLPKPFEPEELLARVRTLIDLKISVDKAKTAEVAFLQAQIKPHFLYNTLNVISSFCDTDPGFAQKLIDDLSTYLRHSFDFKNLEMYVPLEKELSLASSYAEIEKARFGDRLKVEFDIDHSIRSRIPILSIQPLIENAISHGIRKKGGGGRVTVSVKKVPEGVQVEVADDGQGIAEDKLSVLLQPEAGRGIGLWNIDHRLKKLFGSGLTIESTLGKGTKVSYIIPSEVKNVD